MGRAYLALGLMAVAVVVSASLVPVSRALAQRVGVLDRPGRRKIHRRATPRLGGVAVFLTFMSIVLVGYLLIPVLTAAPWAQARFGGALSLLEEA